MSRIQNLNVVAFKVELTEYERGYGQRHWDTWYFDNQDEARRAAINYNKEHNTAASPPDWYVRAEYVGKVE